jgi:hypothetical protein
MELWIEIMECMVDRKTIATCALVASSWVEPAQQLLFRSIEARDVDALINSICLSTDRGKTLTSYVWRLVVWVEDSQPTSGEHISRLLMLMEVCCSLRELSFRLRCRDLPRRLLQRLTIVAQTIRSVEIESYDLQPLYRLFQDIPRWPYLRNLSILCIAPSPPPPKLTAIQIEGLCRVIIKRAVPPLTCMRWLLQGSTCSLMQV